MRERWVTPGDILTLAVLGRFLAGEVLAGRLPLPTALAGAVALASLWAIPSHTVHRVLGWGLSSAALVIFLGQTALASPAEAALVLGLVALPLTVGFVVRGLLGGGTAALVLFLALVAVGALCTLPGIEER